MLKLQKIDNTLQKNLIIYLHLQTKCSHFLNVFCQKTIYLNYIFLKVLFQKCALTHLYTECPANRAPRGNGQKHQIGNSAILGRGQPDRGHRLHGTDRRKARWHNFFVSGRACFVRAAKRQVRDEVHVRLASIDCWRIH